MPHHKDPVSNVYREDIQQAAESMGSLSGITLAVWRLPERLWPEEKVLEMASAYAKCGGKQSEPGVLVRTDQRVIFYYQGVIKSACEDFPFDTITSVQWSDGFLSGKITIHAAGVVSEIEKVSSFRGETFVDAVRKQVAEAKARPVMPQPRSAEQDITALKRLAELHQQGVLTADEFAAKKAEILGRI